MTWLDGVEKRQFPDGGSFYGGGYKIVLHTTEGTTIEGALAAYARYNSAPHFTIDLKTGRVVQHISLNRAARALENRSGGVQTNRANCIQIEIVGFAAQSQYRSDDEIKTLANLLIRIYGTEFHFDLKAPQFYGAGEGIILASYNSPVRLQGNVWTNYSGILAHQHVPENAHWDIGKFPILKLLEFIGGGKIDVTPQIPNPSKPQILYRRGSKGAEVRTIQERLNVHGYFIKVDGDFGPITEKAVEDFQRDKKLAIDRIVGKNTWAALMEEPSRTLVPEFQKYLSRGSYGSEVAQAQAQFKGRGWNIKVDGDFGPQTEAVVKAFQKEKGLKEDGIIGPVTWSAMWLASGAITV